MRESNFSNPAQNKACVCISAAVYDRRAIDCTATLPLINSLNHLAYLTSTSPRIREMVTLDGGLERLIRILRTVPKTPSSTSRSISVKEMQAIWKWSLAFQCVVNIGVRGSENVRTRVVEAGMVPVTVKVLESFLRGVDQAREEKKRESGESRESRQRESGPTSGDATAPRSHRRSSTSHRSRVTSSSETHHQTNSSSLSQPSAQLITSANSRSASASGRPATAENTSRLVVSPDGGSNEDSDPGVLLSESASFNRTGSETRPTTPLEADAAHASVLVSMQAHASSGAYMQPRSSVINDASSGDVRHPMPMLDALESMPLSSPAAELDGTSLHSSVSPSTSASSVLPSIDGPQGTARPFHDATGVLPSHHAGILTNVSSAEDLRSHGGEASGSGSEGAEDADMFGDEADDSEMDMAPGRVEPEMAAAAEEPDDPEDRRTPRPTRRALAPFSEQAPPPPVPSTWATPNQSSATAALMSSRQDTVRPSNTSRPTEPVGSFQVAAQASFRPHTQAYTWHHASHQQQQQPPAAHTPQPAPQQQQRATFVAFSSQHSSRPDGRSSLRQGSAPQNQASATATNASPSNSVEMIYREEEVLLGLQLLAYLSKYSHVRTLFHNSDVTDGFVGPLDAYNRQFETSSASTTSWNPSEAPKRNVFSIAERFTLRSSKSSSTTQPKLAMEIQYWAGVIMRNACRKDETRGGIRQCANMMCGKWEAFPREFAKCRRCRKAKYCSKQCQSKGWQMGHRFWCSARSDDGDLKEKEKEKVPAAPNLTGERPQTADAAAAAAAAAPLATNHEMSATQTITPVNANAQRHHHHHHHHNHLHNHHRPSTSSGAQERVQTASTRRRSQQMPGSFGLPSNRQGQQHLQSQRVSSLASVGTADGSDLSDDEIDRRNFHPPGPSGMHPSIAAAAAAAAARNLEAGDAVGMPISAPHRTDLAGRPLPPPVIAMQDGEGDELAALGGRATPAVMGDQEFTNGQFDQMMGAWDHTPAIGAEGLRQRLGELQAESSQASTPERSVSPASGLHHDSGRPHSPASDTAQDAIDGALDRYAGASRLYAQHFPSPLRPHHLQQRSRLHQQRSVSGFASAPAHGAFPSFAQVQTQNGGFIPGSSSSRNLAGGIVGTSSPLASTPTTATSRHDLASDVSSHNRRAQAEDGNEDVDMTDGDETSFAKSVAKLLVGDDGHAAASSGPAASTSFVESGSIESLGEDIMMSDSRHQQSA
ncbi:hypothetical protein IE53DRAFT_365450 [Violaceomyces palustris]|uniref:Uncharacterized protein n=1 Tax=Violaceomyces palustris TaxID=1673888 RepID=A0ACD0P8R5_9BASI|nr:hypothetical protein IE53DRAFT_365450 [Violaceomyces palustris]